MKPEMRENILINKWEPDKLIHNSNNYTNNNNTVYTNFVTCHNCIVSDLGKLETLTSEASYYTCLLRGISDLYKFLQVGL